MNKLFGSALLATGLAFAGIALALAPGDGEEPPPPPPPPPPVLNECSPGFWKNHPEYWATQYCASSACVDAVMAELTSKGPGSGERRHVAAGNLNSWADTYYGAAVCTE
jgi:rhodanese-related sulfurtransferase